MNLWYFHLSSNFPSALEEFKTNPPDPLPEHGGVLKPVGLRGAALRQKREKCSLTVLTG